MPAPCRWWPSTATRPRAGTATARPSPCAGAPAPRSSCALRAAASRCPASPGGPSSRRASRCTRCRPRAGRRPLGPRLARSMVWPATGCAHARCSRDVTSHRSGALMVCIQPRPPPAATPVPTSVCTAPPNQPAHPWERGAGEPEARAPGAEPGVRDGGGARRPQAGLHPAGQLWRARRCRHGEGHGSPGGAGR